MRLTGQAVACATVAVAVLALGSAAASAQDGYTTIFDGTATGTDASFDKWAQSGPGDFTLQPDGSIRGTGGLGMRWYTVKPFGDVSLKVDYRDSRTEPGYSNGGVMVRSPNPVAPQESFPTTWSYDWPGAPGPWPAARHYQSDPAAERRGDRTACTNILPTRPEWRVIECGQEIQVNDSPDGGTIDPKKTGSVYNFADLDAVQSNAVERYPTLGVWHTMEVRLVGHQYTILVDGKLINQFDEAIPAITVRSFDSPTMARLLLTGYIGVQNHDATDVLDYGNIRVKELSAPPRNTAVPTVAGDGFTGRPLACSSGSWTNVDPGQAYSIDWFRSNRATTSAPLETDYATVKVGSGPSYTPVAADFGKVVWCRVTATNTEGGTAWAYGEAPAITVATDVGGSVGGSVGATLSLALGAPATFGAFTPGVAADYSASTTATVTSTAGDATLSVADPSAIATGHLVNGAFSLPRPLEARARNAANSGTAYNNVGSTAAPLNLLTYEGPISNDAVELQFRQSIGANDALRTGTYSKTLTFTLSTTAP